MPPGQLLEGVAVANVLERSLHQTNYCAWTRDQAPKPRPLANLVAIEAPD
jgi:hypothetical protein